MLLPLAAGKPLPALGIPLGVLIGIITGITLLLLLKTAGSRDGEGIKATAQIIGQALALPAFWFGGPFLTTRLLGSVDPNQIRTSYALSLMGTFLIIACFPLFRLIVAVGNGISGDEH